MDERLKGIEIFRGLNRKDRRRILRRFGFDGRMHTPEKWRERFEAFIRDCDPKTYTLVITHLLRFDNN